MYGDVLQSVKSAWTYEHTLVIQFENERQYWIEVLKRIIEVKIFLVSRARVRKSGTLCHCSVT